MTQLSNRARTLGRHRVWEAEVKHCVYGIDCHVPKKHSKKKKTKEVEKEKKEKCKTLIDRQETTLNGTASALV